MKFRKNRALLELALGAVVLFLVLKERRDARQTQPTPEKEDSIHLNLTPRRIYRQDQEMVTGGIHVRIDGVRREAPGPDGKALFHISLTLENRSGRLYHYDPDHFKRMSAPAADFEPVKDEAGRQYVEVNGVLKDTLTYRVETDLLRFLLLFVGPEKEIVAIQLGIQP